ncbi:MAG TPA: DinB family protein [Candidatus Acidoferrales bacterium]|nr:DinB family protein [Candidatus Acidoferrales bacterium]
MRLSTRVGILLLAGSLGMIASSPQQGAPPGGYPVGRNQTGGAQVPSSITATLDFQLSIEEREVIGLADAMPEDKYSFAPTNGEFKGVRTFAQQVKHIATVNNRFFGAILGQPAATPGSQFEAENGPDSIQTKAQIMQYLRDSFALGHKAIATINADNAFELMKTPPTPFLRTPAAIVIFDCSHTMDHYGQMVVYLRANGIVPPASRQRPPANPPSKPLS